MTPPDSHPAPDPGADFSHNTPAGFRAQWAAPIAQEPPPGDPPPIVADSKPCLACGYDLKGLASTANCPECNAPVIRSLRGNLLRYASLQYLKTLRQGTLIIEFSFLTSVLMTVVGIIIGILASIGTDFSGLISLRRPIEVLSSAAEAIAALIGLLGWWIFSSPDPGLVGEDTGTNARRILRVALIGAAIVALGKASLMFVPDFANALRSVTSPANPGTAGGTTTIQMGTVSIPINNAIPLWAIILAVGGGILGLGLIITRFFASMLYLRGIVRRMPDPEFEGHVKRFTWMGPLLYTVGLILCGLGPLIAFIINWVIVHKTRQSLNRIIAQHTDAPPTPAA